MNRWLIPVAGIALTAVAVSGGVAVWTASGGAGANCDRAALAQSIADGTRQADTAGAAQFMAGATAGCRDEEMRSAMEELTREWHMMPGGMMMRSPDHMGR